MSGDRAAHWERVYGDKDVDAVSWYQREPAVSLALVEAARVAPEAPVVDVGGGASTLVDHLLDRGFADVTVLDISEGALERARERLGERAERVTWLHQDVTQMRAGRTFALWHDRAVFHFLVHPEDRRLYLAALRSHLQPGGQVIVATFGPDGPEQCSGLPVQRYSPESLAQTLGEGFSLVESREEAHVTPAGREQAFVFCRFAREA